MEKLKPHYALKTIQKLLTIPLSRIITRTARKGAVAMGYMDDDDMVEVIHRLRAEHFVKSMTTYENPQIWQDVYKYDDENDNSLYIKLQLSADRKKAVLIQMKNDEGSDE